MCIGISLIISRGRMEPYGLSGENSHEKLKEHFKIRDAGQNIIPVEWHPTGELTDIAAWKFHIDDNAEKYAWFTERENEYIEAARVFLENEILKILNTGNYFGFLDLRGTGITSLGALTSVGGSLDLRDTGITSLGALTSVGGSLYLRDTGIKKENVPENLITKCIW